MKYIPPLNFSPVVSTDVSLYRSGYPMPLNYSFIKHQLHLKTIIYIGDKDRPLEEYQSFLELEKIKYYHIFMDSSRDEGIQERMNQVLHLVLDVRNYPILVHSNKGKHRVGVVVGIIRKLLQGWSTAGIYQEYGLFSGGMKDGVDLEFITMFETNLKIPRNIIPGFAEHCLYLNELEAVEGSDDESESESILTAKQSL
ncbi:Oca2p [Saccharomyces paradoxus]|uniref:Oca2p n=1 Tax=Saccharomyces paradoxus TaxID=27291 RepID=A0A8B8UYU1_SACPA|nr:Oca2 [Saccharomyces paradoxus]QHS75849.1 Oca2 [Saccharomyces paradoxus]